jgi:two-component system LytT family response regulator
MNCIIVDDDKLARTALKQMISNVDILELKAECSDALEAFNYLKKEPIDLVFLDVEMPGMTGIELIKNLVKRPIIILITAKKNYAVEAFELNVADYIIKPVSLSRLTLAVSRAKELFDNKDQIMETTEKDKNFIFVRSNSILSKIKLQDIIYIQALGDYVNIITENKRNTVHCTLKSMENKLPENKFYRLHRSYLVAMDHIDSVEDNTAYSGKHMLPIGEQYKKELLRKLNLI